MRFLLLIQALVSFSAFAGDAGKPIVWTRGDAAYLKSRMPAEQFYVHTPADDARLGHEEGYLQPVERDALFRKLGIESRLKGMDEMDKDILVMDSQAYTVGEMHTQYPMLTEKQLSRLKTEVEKFK